MVEYAVAACVVWIAGQEVCGLVQAAPPGQTSIQLRPITLLDKMKTMRLLQSIGLALLCALSALRGAEVQLPASEEAFLSLVQRAYAESDASILVALTFRELPDGKRVSLESVQRVRALLIGRGLQNLTLEPIEPPSSIVKMDRVLVRTNLPARWRLTVRHSARSATTLFVGTHDEKLRILEQEQIEPKKQSPQRNAGAGPAGSNEASPARSAGVHPTPAGNLRRGGTTRCRRRRG
jgi:hypothetical protein